MQKITEEMDLFVKNLNLDQHNASVVSCWDFNTSLGATILEKYQSLTVKICETTQVLIRNGASGYFWIICSPEVSSIFEKSVKTNKKHDYYPMGIKNRQFIGIMDKRWRVYVDPNMQPTYLLIGHDNSNDLARIAIANFIV